MHELKIKEFDEAANKMLDDDTGNLSIKETDLGRSVLTLVEVL